MKESVIWSAGCRLPPRLNWTVPQAAGPCDQAAHAVQGNQTTPAEHADADSRFLAFTGHLQLSELQLIAHQHSDLLGKLFDQVPAERSWVGSGHAPSALWFMTTTLLLMASCPTRAFAGRTS